VFFGWKKGGFFATVGRDVGNGRLFDFDRAFTERRVSEVGRGGSRTSHFNISQIIRLNVLNRWDHNCALRHGGAVVRKEELWIADWIICLCWGC